MPSIRPPESVFAKEAHDCSKDTREIGGGAEQDRARAFIEELDGSFIDRLLLGTTAAALRKGDSRCTHEEGPNAELSASEHARAQPAGRAARVCAPEPGFVLVRPGGRHSVSKGPVASYAAQKKAAPVEITVNRFAPLSESPTSQAAVEPATGKATERIGSRRATATVPVGKPSVARVGSDASKALRSSDGTCAAGQEGLGGKGAGVASGPSRPAQVDNLFGQDGIIIAQQLMGGQPEDFVYERFIEDKARVNVASLVPRKLPLFDTVASKVARLSPVEATHLSLAEEIVGGMGSVSEEALASNGPILEQQQQILDLIGASDSLLGAAVISAAIVSRSRAPSLRSLPPSDPSSRSAEERLGAVADCFWNQLAAPAILVFDGTAVVSTLLSSAPAASVAAILVPIGSSLTGTKLMVDAATETFRAVQAQKDSRQEGPTCRPDAGLRAAAGALLVGGGVALLAGSQVGALAVGSGAIIAAANSIAKGLVRCRKSPAIQERDSTDERWKELLDGQEKVSIDTVSRCEDFEPLFDKGVIVPAKIKIQLEYYGIGPNEKMISKKQLEFIRAEVDNYQEAVSKANEAADIEAIGNAFRYEIADCVVAAAILNRAEVLAKEGSKRALDERNALIEKRFYNNLQRGGIVDLAIKERLLIEAIKATYDGLPLNRTSLWRSDVKVHELLKPLAQMDAEGERRVDPSFRHDDPISLADFNIRFKETYIRLKRDFIHECVVSKKTLVAEPIMTAEQITELGQAGAIDI